jgi:hypothetical protein
MVWKELRQILGIALEALVLYALLVLLQVRPQTLTAIPLSDTLDNFFNLSIRQSNQEIPFIYDNNFGGRYWWISLLTSLALGFQQTLVESKHGTYLFLLHRPATRRWLVGTKLSVGLATYLICSAMPILIYGGWATRNCMLFTWPMTLSCWHTWLLMTLPYFGAFLTGMRQGRWYGTRLLPLLAACVPIFLLENMAPQNFLRFSDLLSPCIAFVLLDILLVIAILFVTKTRDFS